MSRIGVFGGATEHKQNYMLAELTKIRKMTAIDLLHRLGKVPTKEQIAFLTKTAKEGIYDPIARCFEINEE